MTIACSECGAPQHIGTLPRGAAADCFRCETPLERTAGRSAGAALALSIAALALFFPGNVLPLMRSDLLGGSIEARAIDGVSAYFSQGRPVMASFVAMFVIVAPMLRAAFLIVVLGSLRLGWRERWQARLFRLAGALRGWAMAEVYIAAGAVTFGRIAAQLDIDLLPGGWCFIAATALLLVAEAALDERRIWTALMPDPPVSPGVPVLSCISCDLVLPADRVGEPCPRCARRLRVRRRDSVKRAAALTLAAVFLLYPAYFLPMVVTVQPNGVVDRTIMDGVITLFSRGFWYLGVIIFVVSVVIPFSKLATLIWLTVSIRFPHRHLLPLRTRLHRMVDKINHWSFLDPFIVALNSAMLSYPGIASVTPGDGALPFALVVVLTMIASRMLDPRLMWDAAGLKA